VRRPGLQRESEERIQAVCGLEVRDTAGWKPALRETGAAGFGWGDFPWMRIDRPCIELYRLTATGQANRVTFFRIEKFVIGYVNTTGHRAGIVKVKAAEVCRTPRR
jgi:hypothetical protein